MLERCRDHERVVRMLFFVLVLDIGRKSDEVGWSQMKSQVSGRAGGKFEICQGRRNLRNLIRNFIRRNCEVLIKFFRKCLKPSLFVLFVLRRSGRDRYCVGLRHLCAEELGPGSAVGRNAGPRHSATPHAIRASD